jgi:hypothetical protein
MEARGLVNKLPLDVWGDALYLKWDRCGNVTNPPLAPSSPPAAMTATISCTLHIIPSRLMENTLRDRHTLESLRGETVPLSREVSPAALTTWQERIITVRCIVDDARLHQRDGVRWPGVQTILMMSM